MQLYVVLPLLPPPWPPMSCLNTLTCRAVSFTHYVPETLIMIFNTVRIFSGLVYCVVYCCWKTFSGNALKFIQQWFLLLLLLSFVQFVLTCDVWLSESLGNTVLISTSRIVKTLQYTRYCRNRDWCDKTTTFQLECPSKINYVWKSWNIA